MSEEEKTELYSLLLVLAKKIQKLENKASNTISMKSDDTLLKELLKEASRINLNH